MLKFFENNLKNAKTNKTKQKFYVLWLTNKKHQTKTVNYNNKKLNQSIELENKQKPKVVYTHAITNYCMFDLFEAIKWFWFEFTFIFGGNKVFLYIIIEKKKKKTNKNIQKLYGSMSTMFSILKLIISKLQFYRLLYWQWNI